MLLLRIETTKRPHVPPSERLSIEELGGGIYRGVARFGFMYPPDLSKALAEGLPFDLGAAVFFLPEVIDTKEAPWWQAWLRRGYLFLGGTGLDPVEYFHLPPNQVVKVGVDLEL